MMSGDRFVLLSFDAEEFDMPLEYGQQIELQEQLDVANASLEILMNLIDKMPVEATFFTTATFATHFPEAIQTISKKHEIASHTFYHSRFCVEDLVTSKEALEAITGQPVTGLRMPRMRPVEMKDVLAAGYTYDSSINPTWVPGRYNNLHLSRVPYMQQGVLRFPASVTPNLRIPLFWLSFKNLPYSFYLSLVKQTLKKDGYVCLYFHPWEFINLDSYQIPLYTKRYAGEKLLMLLQRLILDLAKSATFITMADYISKQALDKRVE